MVILGFTLIVVPVEPLLQLITLAQLLAVKFTICPPQVVVEPDTVGAGNGVIITITSLLAALVPQLLLQVEV